MEQFTITQANPQVVEVSQGARGARGLTGDKGDQGDQGNSILMRGIWNSALQYNPLDAVTWRSTGTASVQSLYIHRSDAPLAPVGLPPNEGLSYWSEVGLSSINASLGAIWTVTQVNHGFVRVGTPVTVDNGLYVGASAQTLPDTAIAVIREIPDDDTLILQSDGFVPYCNPDVNITPGNTWVLGQDYWLSPVPGRVQESPSAGAVAQMIYRVVAIRGDGTADVVLTMTNDLPVVPTPNPVPAASTTDEKVDNIAGQFDGVTQQFPLTVATAPVPWPAPETSFLIYIDGNPQEPGIDFQVIEGNSGEADIFFIEAPEDYEEFWGIFTLALGVASTVGIGGVFPAGAASGALWYLTDGPIGLYLYVDDGNSQQWVLVDSQGDIV